MTAKEYLNNIRSFRPRLRIKEQQLQQLRRDIGSLKAVDCTRERVCGTPHMDIADKIAQIDELITQINTELDELIRAREEARQLIDRLQDVREQQVLSARYILCETWEQIAVDMGFTRQHTHRIHGAALVSLQKFMEDESKCDRM